MFGSLENFTYICSMDIKEKIAHILKGEDELIKIRKHNTAKSFLNILGIEYEEIGSNGIAVNIGFLNEEQIKAVDMIIEWKNE